MNRFTLSILLAAALGLALASGPVHAQADGKKDETSSSSAPYEKHWYLNVGASNFHPRLWESESKVNSQMNHTLGAVIPSWERPTTFKNWEKDWMIWDADIAIGRDITPKTAWAARTGGAVAMIGNVNRYWPIISDVHFGRKTAFVTLQGYYFPFGKPELKDEPVGPMATLKAAFANAKPYVALGGGYVLMRVTGDAKVNLEGLGRVFRKQDNATQHMLQISPRLGVELPFSDRDSVAVELAYYHFGPEHSREYDGGAWNIGFRHKF